MTKTGTQNRPYTSDVLMVYATFSHGNNVKTYMGFDWNNRDEVRRFAAISDEHIRTGGSTMLENVPLSLIRDRQVAGYHNTKTASDLNVSNAAVEWALSLEA